MWKSNRPGLANNFNNHIFAMLSGQFYFTFVSINVLVNKMYYRLREKLNNLKWDKLLLTTNMSPKQSLGTKLHQVQGFSQERKGLSTF